MGKGAKKSSDDTVDVEVTPGVGGYSVAVYKQDKLKGASPLDEDTYKYIKQKYKKHSSASSSPLKKPSLSLQKSHKSIGKKESSSAAPAKERKPLTDAQKENLRRGREARALKIKQLKEEKLKSGAAAATPSSV